MASPKPGPLIRMRALPPNELPAHPLLAAQQTTPISTNQFVSDVLTEAHEFATNYWPTHFTVKSKTKQSPPSTAPVELLAHDIPLKDLPNKATSPETWFARTSIHENAAKTGTASWEEFDLGLRADHSKHEQDYTPACIDGHKVLDWDEHLGTVEGWGEVHMNLMEMCHQLPFPLSKRFFSVLVITANRVSGGQEFLVVQIPVDTDNIPGTKYAKDAKYTEGMYCSIERCVVEDGGSKVKWQMGTASDAMGTLPMAVQKMAMPGAVVKDVGWFIDWCDQRRKGSA